MGGERSVARGGVHALPPLAGWLGSSRQAGRGALRVGPRERHTEREGALDGAALVTSCYFSLSLSSSCLSYFPTPFL